MLVVTVRLQDDKVKVLEVVQGPVFDQPAGDKGEYRVEIHRDNKKISSRFFDLILGEIRIYLPDQTHQYAQATSAMKHLVLPITQGGTTDQFVVKVFRGTQEVFASSLDKLPFRRNAGITDPIRSKEEIELLKLAKPQAAAETPGEAAPSGFSWSFIIWGAVILAGLLGLAFLARRKKESEDI